MRMNRMKPVAPLLALCALAAPMRAGDCPMWGYDSSRNMVSAETGLPVSAVTGKAKPGTDEIDPAPTQNVKWVARLGSQTYGNPTVAAGRVYVGTNNDAPRDPKYVGDHGVLLCLNEESGELLWQLVVPKLGAGLVVDYPEVVLCSPATVDE